MIRLLVLLLCFSTGMESKYVTATARPRVVQTNSNMARIKSNMNIVCTLVLVFLCLIKSRLCVFSSDPGHGEQCEAASEGEQQAHQHLPS
jgi:hypothetical protein